VANGQFGRSVISYYLNDEESSEDEKNRLEVSAMFKNRGTEGAFQILVRRHLRCVMTNNLGDT